MKFLFLSVFILISSSAYSLEIGDRASYTVLAPGNVQTVTVMVTQINGNEYTAEATSQTYALPTRTIRGSLAKLALLKTIYEKCEAFGGRIESVTIVTGIYAACHVRDGEDEAYLSPEVTFGVVKQITHGADGVTESVLNSFYQN